MKIKKKLKFTFLITNREVAPKIIEFLKNKGIEIQIDMQSPFIK